MASQPVRHTSRMHFHFDSSAALFFAELVGRGISDDARRCTRISRKVFKWLRARMGVMLRIRLRGGDRRTWIFLLFLLKLPGVVNFECPCTWKIFLLFTDYPVEVEDNIFSIECRASFVLNMDKFFV